MRTLVNGLSKSIANSAFDGGEQRGLRLLSTVSRRTRDTNAQQSTHTLGDITQGHRAKSIRIHLVDEVMTDVGVWMCGFGWPRDISGTGLCIGDIWACEL